MTMKRFGACLIILMVAVFSSIAYGADKIATSAAGNTIAGRAMAPTHVGTKKTPAPKSIEKPVYTKNNSLADFQIHFFISLPFTALYSYLAVSSMDAIVQGQYPTAFRTTNSWMIIGLAVGTSLAIALGNIGRVPDQTIPDLNSGLNWQEATETAQCSSKVVAEKMELLKILY